MCSILLTSVYIGWKLPIRKRSFRSSLAGSEPIGEAEKVLQGLLSNRQKRSGGKASSFGLSFLPNPDHKFLAIRERDIGRAANQVRANNYGLQIEFLGIKKLRAS
jgi:hypothetical protein